MQNNVKSNLKGTSEPSVSDFQKNLGNFTLLCLKLLRPRRNCTSSLSCTCMYNEYASDDKKYDNDNYIDPY